MPSRSRAGSSPSGWSLRSTRVRPPRAASARPPRRGVSGRQSAGVVVVPSSGEPHDRAVDLRVEDHADPLGELRRLLALHRAYERAGTADELVAQGRHDEAADAYRQAADLAPGNDELLFWAGLAAVQQGDREPGLDMVRRAIAANDGWRAILPRLSDDIAPSAAEVRGALGL